MSTAKESLETRDKILDEYENNLGIAKYQSPGKSDELELYLTMDRDVLEKMSIEECDYIALRLGQFAFHIQRAQNRDKARMAWAKNEIRMTIADKLGSYSGYGYEEKASQAIKGDEHASTLNKIYAFAEQRSQRLEFTANGLNNLGKLIQSIKFNKKDARPHE